MDTNKKLEVKNLSFSYDGKKTIISNISFELNAGEVFVILGPNGSGKSTLLNCIANILKPTGGEGLVNGKSIYEMPVNELALIMGYVPQISTLAFSYTVRDYVVMGRAPHLGLLKVPGEAEYALADEVMDDMGISHLSDKIYSNISGGERQQAQIAKVLAQKTEIILLDEPTNHLDYGNQLKIIKEISKLAKEHDLAILMTSHMPDHAMLLNSKVGILDNTGHMEVGTPDNMISEDSLRRLYQTDLHLVYIEELERYVCVSGRL